MNRATPSTFRIITQSAGVIAIAVASTGAHALGKPAPPAAPPIVATSFESDPGDWHVMNVTGGVAESAKLSVVHDTARVKEGKGSLLLDYSIKKGDTNLLFLPCAPPSLTRMKSVHFWIKPDHSTSMLFIASQKGGSRYQTSFTCIANKWQEVSIALSDLTMSQDEDNPKDASGTIDPNKIEGIGLIDSDCYLAQVFGDNPPPITLPLGSHELLINSFTIDETLMPPIQPPTETNKVFASTLRPQVDWMVLGDIAVQKVTEKPLIGSGIKATYLQQKNKVAALIKPLGPGVLAGATGLHLSIGSKLPTTIIVEVEETDGGKYNTTISLNGNSEMKDFNLKFADFVVSQDSKDKNDKLDLPLVKQIMLIDMTGLGEIQDMENNLWLANVHSIK